jgi:predicted nucleic acid-binding protein
MERAPSLVFFRLRYNAAWEGIANELRAAPIEFHPGDRRLADAAADFKAGHSISLADAFAAALAQERQTDLVTGDPELKPLEKEIKINWLTTKMNTDLAKLSCLAALRPLQRQR